MDEMTRAEKLRLAGIKRFGSEDAWREHLRVSARKAGHTKPQGFAVIAQRDPALHKQISSKGGKWKRVQ